MHAMAHTLMALIEGMHPQAVRGSLDLEVLGICYDSRQAKPGWLFVALPGIHTDGARFIQSAIKNGARSIVHQDELSEYVAGISYVRLSDTRFSMSALADRFYDSPSKRITVIGVTGTEGKSTVTWLIYRLLDLAGCKVGFISTVEYRVADTVLPNPEHQTTPEATTIHEKLSAMLEHGLDYAVVESSSHGLSKRTNRLGDVHFDVGIMTNVRHEHLEFHGSWECYRDDKANLFRALDRAIPNKHPATRPYSDARSIAPKPFGVVCADDDSADYFRAVTKVPVYTYSMKSPHAADLWAQDIGEDSRGTDFTIAWNGGSVRTRANLPGRFNVENVLASLVVVSGLSGMGYEKLAALVPALEPVRGRMSRIDCGQKFELIVDYAHTPSSFDAVLKPLRDRAGKHRLVCVFGSAGERDTQKRPEQGAIAARYCDVLILTDEDPRGEQPMAILEDIAQGVQGKTRGTDLFLIPDRRAAIAQGLSMAGDGDIVVLLGKGHENSIIYNGTSIAWNEIEEAQAALNALGYRKERA